MLTAVTRDALAPRGELGLSRVELTVLSEGGCGLAVVEPTDCQSSLIVYQGVQPHSRSW